MKGVDVDPAPFEMGRRHPRDLLLHGVGGAEVGPGRLAVEVELDQAP